MLDEYCATRQVGRKHAIAMFGRAVRALADEVARVLRVPRQRTGRGPFWETAKRPCGKRRAGRLLT